MRVQDEIAKLRQENRRLRQEIAARPVLVPTGARSDFMLRIVDGNTVYNSGGTTYYGIKLSASEITSVPSAYDPNSVGVTPGLFSAMDGIGRAYLYVNGVVRDNLVLVVNDNRSENLLQSLMLNEGLYSTLRSHRIQVGSSGVYVRAYVPHFT